MDKDFHKSFTVCPCCGSASRFFESLAQELKDTGKASKDLHAYYNAIQGAVVDQKRTSLLPVGATVPGFAVATDICTECGCVYAVELRRQDARLETRMPQVPASI